MAAAIFSALALATEASLASTITRTTGSVPEARNTTRPCCPNSCSTCFNTGYAAGCQAWPLLMRTLIMVCG